jgi:uncharacterized membrane protein
MAVKVSPLSGVVAVPRATVRGRILGIDALRGLALVVMALDHAASFVGVSLQAESYGGQPAILENWAHWVSGLITNLAAPAFWLLSGVSLALFVASRRRRGMSEKSITTFLLTRAGVILLLDLTLCQWAWAGQGPYTHVLLSIAICLALMSVLRLLPIQWIAGIMLLLLVSYQLVLPTIAPVYSQTDNVWSALLLAYSTRTFPAIEYSVWGWLPLMGLGFVFGQNISAPLLSRWQSWVAIGGGLLGGWLVLRVIGGFGDLTPFVAYDDVRWYHFLIMSKTPPSLSYLTFNLGLASLMLAAFYAWGNLLERFPGQWLVIIGQVSLFFFVAHIVVYGILGRTMSVLGLPLPGMVRAYLAWMIGLLILLPLAQKYRSLRRRHPQSLLRYL